MPLELLRCSTTCHRLCLVALSAQTYWWPPYGPILYSSIVCFTSARRAYHTLTFAIRATPTPATCICSFIHLIDLVHSHIHTYTTRRHARLGPAPFAWHSSWSSTFTTEQFRICNLCLFCLSFVSRYPFTCVYCDAQSGHYLDTPHISICYETILSVRASHILYLTSITRLVSSSFLSFSLALASGCNSLFRRVPFAEIQFTSQKSY